MPLQITLQNPEYYLERIKAGCILDPSVFYSEDYVKATTHLISSIKPKDVYLPSNLLKAHAKSDWASFLSTLTLWSGNYEKLPGAWYQSDILVKELKPIPIEISEQDEKVRAIFEAMAEKGAISPLNKILFEITAFSVEKSIPVYVGSHSKFRLLELLNSKLQTIVIEPLGQWASKKKQFLTEKTSRTVVFALLLMGGAFIFIESLGTASILGIGGSGAVIFATVIDGSL